jgi:hypothetical protein
MSLWLYRNYLSVVVERLILFLWCLQYFHHQSCHLHFNFDCLKETNISRTLFTDKGQPFRFPSPKNQALHRNHSSWGMNHLDHSIGTRGFLLWLSGIAKSASLMPSLWLLLLSCCCCCLLLLQRCCCCCYCCTVVVGAGAGAAVSAAWKYGRQHTYCSTSLAAATGASFGQVLLLLLVLVILVS